jgi:hypothetical protein
MAYLCLAVLLQSGALSARPSIAPSLGSWPASESPYIVLVGLVLQRCIEGVHMVPVGRPPPTQSKRYQPESADLYVMSVLLGSRPRPHGPYTHPSIAGDILEVSEGPQVKQGGRQVE